ncbi:MAG TPA: protease modulator HflC [Aestuariivirgaceae bacterium]|nr:protease modulator HflC [Aestuariivirgaceae bacterium]
MNMLKTGGLIAVAALAILVYSSIFTVDERESALVIRFGEIQRTVEEPGLYFKLPLFEELRKVELRMMFMQSTDKAVQVVDGRRYSVDAITMVRIVSPQRFRETVDANLALARDRIETRLDAALRQTYGRRSFGAALSDDRTAMMHEIRDQVRREAESLGIEIVDVRIRRTELMPDVLQDTYARMSAERFAEAAELRAIGQAQATRIEAEADRAAVELLATAQRESEIIRGEGDAERNRTFAEAFGRDVEFFNFYRSMQAYTKSLAGTETTLVLSPDSEFFRHFGMGGSSPEPQQVELEQPPAPQARRLFESDEVSGEPQAAQDAPQAAPEEQPPAPQARKRLFDSPVESGEPQAAQVAPQAAPEEGAPQQQ